MNSKSIRSTGTAGARTANFTIIRILLAISVALLTNLIPVGAHALGKVTVSWQANPPQNYVLGYRLYYGTSSRYNSNGLPKANFSYQYYIDFSDFERCVAGETNPVCEKISLQEVQCENLLGENPRCTIFNLNDQQYFAMTAYNAEGESGYTYELTSGGNRRALIAVQNISSLLLTKKKR